MSLINCIECKNKLSDKAIFCPHCGYPLNSKRTIVANSEEKELDKLLKPKDIKVILGCGMQRAYDIINQRDFPKIKIGKRFYIPQKEFEKWLEMYTRKEYKI